LKPLLYALAGAALWGAAPIFGKLGLIRLDPVVALSVRSLAVAAAITGWAAFSGRLSGPVSMDIRSVIFIGAEGLLASVLGHLAYFFALKHGEASRVAPVVAAYPVFTLGIAIMALGERLTAPKLVGTAMVLAGVILLGR